VAIQVLPGARIVSIVQQCRGAGGGKQEKQEWEAHRVHTGQFGHRGRLHAAVLLSILPPSPIPLESVVNERWPWAEVQRRIAEARDVVTVGGVRVDLRQLASRFEQVFAIPDGGRVLVAAAALSGDLQRVFEKLQGMGVAFPLFRRDGSAFPYFARNAGTHVQHGTKEAYAWSNTSVAFQPAEWYDELLCVLATLLTSMLGGASSRHGLATQALVSAACTSGVCL